MPVYFIQAGDGGMVKIGYSAHPESRLSKMQSDSAVRLAILGIMPGALAEEQAMHERFAAHRELGEWFRPAQEIVDFARSFGVPPRLRRAVYMRYPDSPLKAWLERNQITAYDLSVRVGITHAQISRVLNGKCGPSWALVLRIMDVTGGEIMPNDFLPLAALSTAAAARRAA